MSKPNKEYLKPLVAYFAVGASIAILLSLGIYITNFLSNKSYESSYTSSYSNIVEAAMPAVVNIYSQRVKSSTPKNYKFPYDSIFRFNPKIETSLGSGVIFSPSGYILTNLHVIGSNNLNVTIELADGRKKAAKIIGADKGTDLAVLKIEEAENLPSLKIGNSDELKIGDVVLAIGNPYGVGKSVSLGIISATGREFNNPFSNYIQTDAAINKGNSGGALVDSKGRLVGINTFIRSSSGGSEGIGLAIPSLTALEIFNDLVKFGEVRRGWLGFNIDPNTLRSSGTLLVNYIHSNSPAEQGNLKNGDIILKINNKTSSYEDLFREFVRSKPGEEISLQINRLGEIKELRFVAVAPPE